MNKHVWHRAFTNTKTSQHPSPRWGHNCCVIGQEVVFFGGYADSIYMNDLWSFNTVTMEWNEIKTTGELPTSRSNFSMNYDKEANKVLIFGGGGPNKKRFNTINVLDWDTKNWTEIIPAPNQNAPWERTYHSAELLSHYLIVYGGEGIADLDDLWVYNFNTNEWKEIKFDKNDKKPCARRFHSSAIVGNQFFVIAGCHSKYRCLSDIYSVDLSSLVATGNVEQLTWVERKITGAAFLTRWGHSTAVYDRKIYIFGGRFSNDLNDLLVFDIDKNTLKSVKVGPQVPKARRRHSAVFVGSCMMIFGGFNGQYFNDLYYINLFDLKSKLSTPESCKDSNYSRFVNNRCLSDHTIQTLDKKEVYVHKGLIQSRFPSEMQMNGFLAAIEETYLEVEVIMLLETLYCGVGKIYQDLVSQFSIELHESVAKREEETRKSINSALQQSLKPSSKVQPVIRLSDQDFSYHIELQRNPEFSDVRLIINDHYILKTNRALLGSSSRYFGGLLSKNHSQNEQIAMKLPTENIVIMQILMFYLALDYVVVPEGMTQKNWMQLCQLAEYFCLGRLIVICEQELCMMLGEENVDQLMQFSIILELDVLALYCADFKIKEILSKQDIGVAIKESEDQALNARKEELINVVYHQLRFDIDQIRIERERIIEHNLKKKDSQNTTESEKENYEINGNYY